jgi:hypothetical protein
MPDPEEPMDASHIDFASVKARELAIQNLLKEMGKERRETIGNVIAKKLKQHIFISYSRMDQEIMQKVIADLKKDGLNVWVDQEGLEVGTRSWKKAIEKAIDEASCIVVILSPDAKQSEWVSAELDYGQTQGKAIFPILAKGNKSNAVPFGFTLMQWIDVANKDYHLEMDKLVTALLKHLLA